MTIYECKRCGFSTNIRKKLEIHLKNKRICKPVYNDIDRSILSQEFEEYKKANLKCGIICKLTPIDSSATPIDSGKINAKNNYQCKYCYLNFTKNCNLKRHEQFRCKVQKETEE